VNVEAGLITGQIAVQMASKPHGHRQRRSGYLGPNEERKNFSQPF